MFLGTGLQHGAVFQRNASGVSEHAFSGTAKAAGELFLRVYRKGELVSGFENKCIGCCRKGKLTGLIADLPTGGPYTLEFTIAGSREKAVVKDILVGDLWLLAGQSNMAGSAFMPSLSETSSMVHAFYMDNTWGIAQAPIHDPGRAAAPVHGGNPANRPRSGRGAGPGLPFAVEMYKLTGVPQAVIPCAHGGTSLAQWDPALKKLKGNSLYGAAVEQVKMLGGKVAGLLWYQGCNETGSDEKVQAYKSETKKLFAAFRRDCQNPALPIVLVQLGSFVTERDLTDHAGYRWLAVRNDQYQLGLQLKNCTCVPAIDLELDDCIHLSNRAVAVLGKRMAEAMLYLRGEKSVMPQIKVKNIKVKMCKVTANAIYTVEFSNTVGNLTSGSLPCGFGLANEAGELICEAVNTRLQGNKATFTTRVPFMTAVAKKYQVCYGGSLQPHCNITDEGGRSLPCFISKVNYAAGKVSNLLSGALISEAVFGNDELEGFRLPAAEDLAKLKFTAASGKSFFVPCPREAGELNKAAKIYYYKFAAEVAADCTVKIMFGADANFVLYCDGKEIMHKQTSNPVILDEFQQKMELTAGTHQFFCAFSSNRGNGWGICCRFSAEKKQYLPEFCSTDQII